MHLGDKPLGYLGTVLAGATFVGGPTPCQGPVLSGILMLAAKRLLGPTVVPESFIVDRSGTIVSKVIGPEQWDSEARQELFRRLLTDRS